MQFEDFRNEPIGAGEYVMDIFRPSDRLAIVIKHEKASGLIQRIATAEQVATYRFKAWLRYENARGGNIYVGMNPLKPEARGRTKRDIAAVRHLYLDLDANGTEALAAILADRTLPRPNYVLHTSIGKHQVVWNVEGFEAEQAEHLQRAMALVYGADRAATDVTRVLRIPGFNNRKYDPPYRVTAWKHADAIYIPRDFHVDLRSELSPVTQPLGEQHAVRINRTSQSERDWAETLRRLEQHESPADVQEWLMQKRRDKPYPNFYASLTVRKAIAELERRRTAKLSMEFS